MPYVSSEERERLNLYAWGSDVPQEALDAAEAALTPAALEPDPVATPAPKRARKSNGQFQGDDPNTAEVNEAFVGS